MKLRREVYASFRAIDRHAAAETFLDQRKRYISAVNAAVSASEASR